MLFFCKLSKFLISLNFYHLSNIIGKAIKEIKIKSIYKNKENQEKKLKKEKEDIDEKKKY